MKDCWVLMGTMRDPAFGVGSFLKLRSIVAADKTLVPLNPVKPLEFSRYMGNFPCCPNVIAFMQENPKFLMVIIKLLFLQK